MTDKKLFYGKRKYADEWVYGTLSVFEGGMSIWSGELQDDVEVIPSTVRLIEECSFDCEYGDLIKKIVRCKDCKYFDFSPDGKGGTICYCSHDSGLCDWIKEDYFCSYGVRRDSNEND